MIASGALFRIGRLTIAVFLVIQIFAGFAAASPAFAQDIPGGLDTEGSTLENIPTYSGVQGSVETYLCSPDDSNIGGALFTCITKAYRFGIAFGAIALVFFVVIAGYFYISGGEAAKEKGKQVFLSALTGMALILGSYVLLGFINPDLLKIKTIQPPIFNVADLPSCEEVGFGQNCVLPSGQVQIVSNSGSGVSYGGKGCKPITNDASPASVNNLSKTCFGQFGPEVVKQASIVASSESGGVAGLPVGAGACGRGKPQARCTGGEIPVYGIFQINLIVHKVAGIDCPSAFRTTSGGRHNGSFCNAGNQCVVTDKNIYNQCVQAIKNPKNDIDVACRLYSAAKAAGKPPFNDWGNTRNEHGKRCGF